MTQPLEWCAPFQTLIGHEHLPQKQRSVRLECRLLLALVALSLIVLF